MYYKFSVVCRILETRREIEKGEERERERERRGRAGAGESRSRRASIINAPDKLFASINSAFRHINDSRKNNQLGQARYTHICIHTHTLTQVDIYTLPHTCNIFAVCIYRK